MGGLPRVRDLTLRRRVAVAAVLAKSKPATSSVERMHAANGEKARRHQSWGRNAGYLSRSLAEVPFEFALGFNPHSWHGI